MTFRPTILFAVANEGTAKRILAVQAPQTIDANDPGVTGFTLAGTVSLVDGTGTALAGTLYHQAFTISWDGVGTFTGKIGFNRAGFDGLSTIFQDRLVKAFATGGKIVLSVSAGLAAPLRLPIRLAALRTSDFLVNGAGTSATPAHHPGAAGPNLAAPAPVAGESYTFQCAALGAGSLTVDAAGVFTVSAATPPASTSNLALTITTTRTEDDGTTPTPVPTLFTATSVLPIDLHLRTECIVTVDRSGSMGATAGSSTKWDEAITAANLFSTLYGDAIPARSTPNGTVLDSHVIRLGRWRWQAAFDAEYQPSAGFGDASTKPQNATGLTPGGGTPIGQSLTDARAQFTTGAWRRRHLLLLTDGMDNSGSPTLLEVKDDFPTNLPTVAANPSGGVFVHTVSYAVAGDVPVYDLHTLATSHAGLFLGSEADSDTFDAEKLRDRFLNVLSRVVPIELDVQAAASSTFLVEDGVERLIFISHGTGNLSAAGPGTDVTNANGSVGGLIWASADDPRPGNWVVSSSGTLGTNIYAVFDVGLRMSNEVVAQGPGRPIKLRARLHFRGTPTTGADVWVGVRRPGESIGEVITGFVRSKGLTKALQGRQGQLLHADLGAMLAGRVVDHGQRGLITAAVAAAGVSAPKGDTKSLQRLLLEAAERARNLELQNTGNAVQLLEVEPGVYEGELPSTLTQEEGVYDFSFQAEGTTPGGYPFARHQRQSTALAPIPAVETSDTHITQTAVGNTVLWTATVFPRSATGRALGPGLGYTLNFHYASEADRKKLPPPVTLDNLDGTYSTRLELPKGAKLPGLLLVFGALGPDSSNGMPVEDRKRAKHVRVRLDKVQVLDDHDGCLTGAGELVFDTVVAPNGNPARAVRTRLPASGVLKVNSGQQVAVNHVIYEGLIEHGAKLSIVIGGTELDSLLFFRREEKLARYRRTLPLQSAHLSPDDEPNDPESLSDWKVWYTVEVE